MEKAQNLKINISLANFAHIQMERNIFRNRKMPVTLTRKSCVYL